MRFEDMNWMDVESYLRKDDRVILILGAIEQHGYLSLATDVRIPQAMADAAGQQSGVLVAPPVSFGISPYFNAYPGTISISTHTFLQVVADVIRSLYHQGFRCFMVLNGHGGNVPAQSLLSELADELPGMVSSWYVWWMSRGVKRVAAEHELKPGHASWMEAFSFTKVCELPAGEKEEVEPGLIRDSKRMREKLGDGVFGGAYEADDAVMDKIFQFCVQDILHDLQLLQEG